VGPKDQSGYGSDNKVPATAVNCTTVIQPLFSAIPPFDFRKIYTVNTSEITDGYHKLQLAETAHL
jgi:hypothetical protein